MKPPAICPRKFPHPSKPSGPPIHYTQEITVDDVINGLGSRIPDVGLRWGDSVTYFLDDGAKGLFAFKSASSAITLFLGTVDILSQVGVHLSEDAKSLTLTMSANGVTWTGGEATLYFRSLSARTEQPHPDGIDPGVDNWGHV